MSKTGDAGLGWLGIARLGLVQSSLGAIVVLTTSTINRVMIVELSLLAVIPGLLVAWHYALQVLRPRWGHGSDTGGARTPWIIGGMATLAAGGFLAAAAVWLTAQSFWPGMLLAAAAFTLIGIGVGAAGTSLLVLMAETVAQTRRPAAATIVWTMMIVGFIITSVIAGKLLDPFSLVRLVWVAAVITAVPSSSAQLRFSALSGVTPRRGLRKPVTRPLWKRLPACGAIATPAALPFSFSCRCWATAPKT